MTSTWDIVQEYLGSLGRLKNPDVFSTGIEYVSNLISEIHEYDHKHGEKISDALFFSRPMEDLKKLMRRSRELEKKEAEG